MPPKSRRNWAFYIYCLIMAFFIPYSIYFTIIGQRPLEWFFIFALIGMLSLFFGSSMNSRQRRFSILFLILIAIIQSSIPILANKGMVFGPDQWRDFKATIYIIDTGTLQNAPGLETGYYSFIPLFNALNAGISLITGWPPMMTFAVLQGALNLLSALCIYAVTMRLVGKSIFSIVATLLFLSTPRLSTIQTVPSTVSISLGFFLILLYMFIKEKTVLLRRVVSITAVLAFTITVLHPVGMFPILAVSLGIILVSYFSNRVKMSVSLISFTKNIFVICMFIILAYWTIDYSVFVNVFNPIRRFVLTLTTFRFQPSIYSPQYQVPGFELFSFAWALPVAFSAAYVVVNIASGRGKNSSERDLSQYLVFVSALAGLALIMSAFLSIVFSPGAALERYVNVPGYALLIFPSSIVLGNILSSRKKILISVAIVILSANIVIGANSPDWAPFEHPTFGSFRSTYTSFVEANSMAPLLSNGTRVYEDHDIPLISVAQIEGITLIADGSYQNARNVLQRFKENTFSDLKASYMNSTIVIKIDEIVDQRLFNEMVNILFSSGMHILLTT